MLTFSPEFHQRILNRRRRVRKVAKIQRIRLSVLIPTRSTTGRWRRIEIRLRPAEARGSGSVLSAINHFLTAIGSDITGRTKRALVVSFISIANKTATVFHRTKDFLPRSRFYFYPLQWNRSCPIGWYWESIRFQENLVVNHVFYFAITLQISFSVNSKNQNTFGVESNNENVVRYMKIHLPYIFFAIVS